MHLLLNFASVRLAAILLSCYVLALNAYPCSDHAGDEHSDIQHIEQTADLTHDHQHDEGEGDSCSPFCQCACCQIHMSEPAAYELEHRTLVYHESFLCATSRLIAFAGAPDSPPPKA